MDSTEKNQDSIRTTDKKSSKNTNLINEIVGSDNSLDGGDLGVNTSEVKRNNEGKISENQILLARGTEKGLILKIDGNFDWEQILNELDAFLGGKKRFFKGGEVLIDWINQTPDNQHLSELDYKLTSEYGLKFTNGKYSSDSGSNYSNHLMELHTRKSSDYSNNSQEKEIPNFFKLDESFEVSSSSAGENKSNSDYSNNDFLNNNYSGKDYSKNDDFNRDALSSKIGPARNEGISELNFSDNNKNDLGKTGKKARMSLHSESSASSEELKFGDTYKFDHFNLNGMGELGTNGNKSNKSSGNSRGDSKYSGSKLMDQFGIGNLIGDEELNCKMVYGTLRSGQRVESLYNLVVIGDVNPGADLVAGGDIIVLGSLRGTAHAAAFEEDGFDKVIVALDMSPMQLRIGSIITRGVDEKSKGPEVARIDNRRIIVETFSPKIFAGKR